MALRNGEHSAYSPAAAVVLRLLLCTAKLENFVFSEFSFFSLSLSLFFLFLLLIYRTCHVLCYIGGNFTNNRRVPALPATGSLYKPPCPVDRAFLSAIPRQLRTKVSARTACAFMASVGRSRWSTVFFKINAHKHNEYI